MFKEELADLKNRFLERLNLVYVMSREQQDIELFNGRITQEKAAQILKHWVRAEDIDVAFIFPLEVNKAQVLMSDLQFLVNGLKPVIDGKISLRASITTS